MMHFFSTNTPKLCNSIVFSSKVKVTFQRICKFFMVER